MDYELSIYESFSFFLFACSDIRGYEKLSTVSKNTFENWFFMMQESVYCRMVLNQSVEKNVIHTIRKAKPPAGLVQILTVTEKQFSKMEFLVGKPDKEVIDTDERLVIL